MFSKQLLLLMTAALLAVGVVVLITLEATKGSHIQLTGSVQKVRLAELDATNTIVVADFRATNPSDYPFVVREVTVIVETADGARVEGSGIARADLPQMFAYYRDLGPQFNDLLTLRDRVASRQTVDRMAAARVPLALAELEKRKRVLVRIDEVDRIVAELAETR